MSIIMRTRAKSQGTVALIVINYYIRVINFLVQIGHVFS